MTHKYLIASLKLGSALFALTAATAAFAQDEPAPAGTSEEQAALANADGARRAGRATPTSSSPRGAARKACRTCRSRSPRSTARRSRTRARSTSPR